MMNEHMLLGKLNLPDAPSIPGLAFRGFRGEVDYPAMVAVITSAKTVDQIERVDSVERVAQYYSHLVNSDPYHDMLFAEVDGLVIAYNRVNWRVERKGDRIYQHFGFMNPEWRRKGIGQAMLRHAEQRLREIAAGHLQDHPGFYESFATNTEVGCNVLLLSEGYTTARHAFNMVRPDLENIQDYKLPEGLEVRPVQPEHYRLIYEASQEAFQDNWGFSPEDTEPLEAWLDNPNFDPTLWRVAWDGDQVAGMVLSFIDIAENLEYNRKRGYTENICVRRPWRRRGLARALIALSLHAIKERGMTEAALGVDSQNETGALQLYESVGFRMVKRFSFYRKPME
jgi:ribosomal protein S18 acetylase RimI-like enzyme